MDANMLSKIINSIGLFCDIIGAWLVAIEIVKVYKGQKHMPNPTWQDVFDAPRETQDYKKWQLLTHKFMFLGLVLLTVGFLLQVASNWVYVCV